jgi:hypothetical protein
MNSVIYVVKNRRFDYKLLSEFIVKKQISLSEDYSKIKLTRDTLITGSCCSCCLETSKNFRRMIEQDNLLCKICTIKNANKTRKITCLEIYGVEHSLQSKNVRQKIKDTCMKNHGVKHHMYSEEVKQTIKNTCLTKYGFENPFQSEKVKEKSRNTCIEKFGVPYAAQNEEVKEKNRATCMQNYGVYHPSQSEKIKDKKKNTCMQNYGVEYPSQSEKMRQKSKDTCMQNYGVEYPIQNAEIQQKCIGTWIQNYGVENPSQSEQVKDKKKYTCMQNYGVEYPMQNAEIAEKTMLSGFKYKNYILPSGKIIHYQGYENFAIEHFIKSGVSEENILNDRISVPEVWYEYEGKMRRYYVDIFIPNQNLCVEVKSTYTLGAKKDQVLIKHEAVKALGYLCEIWVYDNKGNRLEVIS